MGQCNASSKENVSVSDHAGAVWYRVKGKAIGRAGNYEQGIRAAPTARVAEEMAVI